MTPLPAPSPMRKYSVAEIDRMRDALKWSYPTGESYRLAERSAEIEDRLRTYMLNGTEPSELESWSEEQRMKDYSRRAGVGA